MVVVTTQVDPLNKLLRQVNEFEQIIGDIVHEVGKKDADLTQDRVEGQGLATNGSFLTTPSEMPAGRYGQRHARQRQRRGLSIAKVDLSFTGQMWGSWGEVRQGNETGVGFNNEEARAKAVANEDLYDTPIFKPSEQEKEILKGLIRDKIKEFFTGH